jgi:hypothetical protein
MQEQLAADLRRQGLEQAAKFTWENTAAETLLVYDRVIRQGTTATRQPLPTEY